MAQGILRRVTLAIAQESTPLTASTGTRYITPNVELSYDPQVMYVENPSMKYLKDRLQLGRRQFL